MHQKVVFPLPVSKTNARQRTVMYRGMKIWNGWPSDIRHLPRLKKHLMTQNNIPSPIRSCFAAEYLTIGICHFILSHTVFKWFNCHILTV